MEWTSVPYGVFGDPDEVKIVLEGDSVTLHTNLTDIQINDEIRWRFGPDGSSSLLVHIDQNVPSYKDSAEGTFTDRLQILNIKTGDLTIKNMRIKHSGLYKAQIVRPTGVTQRKFSIEVYGEGFMFYARMSKDGFLEEGSDVSLINKSVKKTNGDGLGLKKRGGWLLALILV
ncbi:hypothetical protein E1301_Tti023532 [Triplophysa tibetana]|uniref:Immunoglobulin V-set domain-containing protein n=1 Tax=Triplophysa tibetana TaxID=1572043 RepID=A0A5A9NS62_9TELE|nr:hypothetical protein E1301_Tti023532 [Triplophysa tibetana]